jgi:hypothetical protein
MERMLYLVAPTSAQCEFNEDGAMQLSLNPALKLRKEFEAAVTKVELPTETIRV